MLTKGLTAQVRTRTLTEVRGNVIDNATKEPLSFVNIRIKGSAKSTLTDDNGEFYISSSETFDSIIFSYLGYRSITLPIKPKLQQRLHVKMSSEDLKLAEITVKARKRYKRVIDTAAMFVFHRVLENKELNNSKNVSSYSYDSYDKLQLSLLNPKPGLINFSILKPFRFVFDNKDTTEGGNVFVPIILNEKLSKVYYQKSPPKTKQYVIAQETGGIDNSSLMKLVSYYSMGINVYDNLYVISTVSFVSPFSSGASLIYRYYLTDTAEIEGRVSYKLYFTGKVREDQALKGYAWVDSATWAIQAIDFRPNEKSNINFINDYTIRQDYKLIDDKYWMLKREEMITALALLKGKNRTSMLATITQNRKNIEVNGLFPDSVFAGPETVIVASDSWRKTRDYWDSLRFEPLTNSEKQVHHITDTAKSIPAYKAIDWSTRLLTAGYAGAGPVNIGRLVNFVSRNSIEGWRLRFGFETNIRFKKDGNPVRAFLRRFYFSSYVAYGFKDKEVKYEALTRINLARKNDNWNSLELKYRYDIRVPGMDESQTVLTFDNIFTLLSGRRLSKVMKVREASITYDREWFRGFSTISTLSEKTFYEVPEVFPFTHQTPEGLQRFSNFHVTEFQTDFRYSNMDQYYARVFYRYFQITRFPVFVVRYAAGIVHMPDKRYTYHNVHLTISQRLSSPVGHTIYLFRAGKIFGKAPFTSTYLTQGNLGLLLDRFNYNLLGEFEFVSDQYASLWVEHHFDGFFFNKIPGFNKLRLREVIFVKSLIGSFNRNNSDVLTVPSELRAPGPKPYLEGGFGIENILYIFRVDFIWRLTYRNQIGAPNWGVKIAMRLQL
ncbi:MAG: carboxypeptidase-like regulatory domain-containing protein [Bacteroidetes bacterium]|nr:carboxypeptidase-like regulatory domain-containing protein [Bacteroidota bacterium]